LNQKELLTTKIIGDTFVPTMEKEQRETLYNGWLKAVQRTMKWED